MKSEEASSGDARQKVFMGVEARAACRSHKGTEHKGSRDEPRVFTAPKGHCPWPHPTRHVCAVERTKAEAFGGVRRPAGKQAVQQARRKPAGEHSRRLAPKEHSRRRAPKEHSGTEHRDRSSDKVFTEDFSRGSSPGQDLQRSSSEMLFREALQRSSSLTKTWSKKLNVVFIAEHGSAIEGGCCDTNRTVHARG
jgi:hypothetical protein